MARTPRTPLPDLITEYRLHDDCRHIFVEGADDRAVLNWYLEPTSRKNLAVYDVESIHINADMLSRLLKNS